MGASTSPLAYCHGVRTAEVSEEEAPVELEQPDPGATATPHGDGPWWEANLAALRAARPELAARLDTALPGRRAHRDAAGLHWRPYRHALLLDDDVASALAAARAAEDAGAPLVVLGVGTGAALEAVLGQTRAGVVLWDCDLSLWQELLGWTPLGEAVAEGRLRLVLGVDLVGLALPPGAVVHEHRQLGRYRRWARGLLGGAGPLALVVAGELFVEDVGQALREHGWREYRWDREHLSAAENRHTLAAVQAELVVAINTRVGLCEDADEHGVPVVIWEVDPTTDGPARLERPLARAAVFTYRNANRPALEAAGYGHVAHLPLAASPGRMGSGVADPALGEAVAFVGSSMVDNARRCLARALEVLPGSPRVRQAVERALQIQLQDLGRWLLPELLDQLAPGLRARVAQGHGGLDLAMLLGEHCASQRRLRWLAGLRNDGLVVWGDRGWQALVPHGIDWRGPADHFRDLPRIYRSAAVHVDIGRLYQLDIVTMRVFDVVAAGGFLLAEHSAGLAELFVLGEELETWRTPAELLAKVRHYRAHPEQRRAIAAAGQARVRRDHSIARRVEQLGRSLGLSGFSTEQGEGGS